MLPTFNEHGDLVLLEHYSVWADKIKAGIWLQLYIVPARMVISGNRLGNANSAEKGRRPSLVVLPFTYLWRQIRMWQISVWTLLIACFENVCLCVTL